jgi:hypothetical protein
LQVFETANSYIGYTIGSLANADAICQSEANAAGYAGTYKAIMSDESTAATSRLTLSYPIVNAYDGSTVAATNLWVGSISSEIATPSGYQTFTSVWTGTYQDGSSAFGYTCGGWTNGGGTGEQGQVGLGGAGWIASGNNQACWNDVQLYCIQQ